MWVGRKLAAKQQSTRAWRLTRELWILDPINNEFHCKFKKDSFLREYMCLPQS